jgi:hypothetical protein
MRPTVWILLATLAGCAAPPRERVPPAPAPEVEEPPAEAPAAPAVAYEVAGSRLEIRVFRDGPMQKMGHTHLITSDALTGEIALREPLAASGFTLRLPLESLVVDDPGARAEAGGEFAAPVPAKDAEGTRRNMLGPKLLDAARQPEMHLVAESVTAAPGGYEARVRVSIAGQERVVVAPFTVAIEGGVLKAHAEFSLTHGDLGLQPFNVALGALKVRDEFEVELDLEARRGT